MVNFAPVNKSIMESVEKTIAQDLLSINAVILRPDDPFTWASGWKSPIYCDNRKILSYPAIRERVADAFVEKIKKHYQQVEYIAGVATGAIAVAALVAQKMNLPMVYVRPKPKDHGTGARVEGDLKQGTKVVVVEDLISTGMSSLSAVDALLKEGAIVCGMVAIFSYNFITSISAFEKANVELHTLSYYEALLEQAVATKYIKESDIKVLSEWRISPDKWGI